MTVVDPQMFEFAAFDIERFVSENLRRHLQEVGADELRAMERQPSRVWVSGPRSWWETLLRREPRGRWVPLIEYRMTGFGWVDE
jgi:hypothetical protein